MSMKKVPILFDELHILLRAYPDAHENPEYQKDLLDKILEILKDHESRIDVLERRR